MRMIIHTVVAGAALALALAGAAAAEPAGPCARVHAFYYPWYGNPATEGHWVHWDHPVDTRGGEPRSYAPPEQIGANFYPALGLYSSNSPKDVAAQMAQLRSAGVGVAATSWWGVDDYTDKAVPLLLDQAAAHGLKVCFHLEPLAGRDHPDVLKYRDAVAHVIDNYGAHPAFYRDAARGGRPLFYVYDSYLVRAEEWARILTPDGDATLRGTPHDAVMIGLWVKAPDGRALVRGGFNGFYTYFATDGFTYGSTPAHWEELAAFADEHGLLFIPSVGPGYDDTRIRPWNTVNQRGREAGAYYDRMWRKAIDIDAACVSITSFNEWHEGTQIEPAAPKSTPSYTYLDYAPRAPEYYLERTAHWTKALTGAAE